MNPPCLVSMNGDIMTTSEYVEVALALPGGIDIAGIDVALTPDGHQVNISYDWPRGLYEMQQLYEDEIKLNSNTYPSILSMKEELKSHRSKSDLAPRSTMAIPLPVPVQTDVSTWIQSGKVGFDGEVIIKVKFRVHQKNYDIPTATKIPFTFKKL